MGYRLLYELFKDRFYELPLCPAVTTCVVDRVRGSKAGEWSSNPALE